MLLKAAIITSDKQAPTVYSLSDFVTVGAYVQKLSQDSPTGFTGLSPEVWLEERADTSAGAGRGQINLNRQADIFR